MAISFAVVGTPTPNRLVLRATSGAIADTGTRTNAQLKTDYKHPTSTLGRIIHSTNTVANTLKNALIANPGSVKIVPEVGASVWRVAVTEGAGPNFAVQLDVATAAGAAADTALIYLEGGPSNAI